MAIEGTPNRCEIWKLKSKGKIWLFKSNGQNSGFLTEHDGAYCWDCNGDVYFREYVSHYTGRCIVNDSDIEFLKRANKNERVIFERKMRI